MATKTVNGTTNLPATQTQNGCCEWFLAGLKQIKEWACAFFRCLFCCSRSEPKPMPPITVQTQTSSQTTATTVRVEEPGKMPEPPQITFDGSTMTQRVKTIKTVENQRNVLNRSGVAVLRCLCLADQIDLLRSWSDIIIDWTPFIRVLPSAVQERLTPDNPKFSEISIPLSKEVAPEKLFLHSILSRLFFEQPGSLRFSDAYLETFKTFTAEQQFFIIYTLAAIGMDDPQLTTRLNYTEISKLINHSKIKEPLYACRKKQPSVMQDPHDVLTLFDRVDFMITNANDLTAHFTWLEDMAKQAPWNTLLSMPQAVAPSQPVVQRPVSPEVRAFVGRYCACVARMAKKAQKEKNKLLYLDTLHREILRILVKPEDQFFLLQQLASNRYVDTWFSMINHLPYALKVKIFAKLAEQIKVPLQTVHESDGDLIINPDYADVEHLAPVFDALAEEQTTTRLTEVEQFIQEMVFQFCDLPKNSISYFDIFNLTEKHKQQFKVFSQRNQAIVMHTIIGIRNDVFNNYLTPLLNALFDISHFQKEPGTQPFAVIGKEKLYRILEEAATELE